jgi:hypothetical protein
MRATFTRWATVGTAATLAATLVLGVRAAAPTPVLSTCGEQLFVYDPHIDEIIPAHYVDALDSAIPPVQPGDKLAHHLRPWSVYCAGVLVTPQ